MAMKEATLKQLEQVIKELKVQGKEIKLEAVQKALAQKQLSISEQKFYNHIYAQHLYDWREKAPPEQLKAEEQTQQKISELEKNLSLVRATLESTADGILMISREGKLINWNKKFMEMFRIPASVLESRDERAGLKSFMDQVVDPQALFDMVTHLYDDPTIKGEMGDLYFKDGRIFERYSQPYIANNQIIGRVWSFRNVTERRKKDQELRLRERAIEASTQGVMIVDNSPNNTILYVNPAFEKITGQTAQHALGQNCFFWIINGSQQAVIENIKSTFREKREGKVTVSTHHEDETKYWTEINIAPVPNEKGEVTHFVWIINDITQRKIMEDKLAHQATHDSLTNLPNRLLLQDRIQRAILHAKRSNSLVAIYFLDLDRFKLTNDALGHGVGDQLLRIVGKNLIECMRDIDTVARLGGDEFVIVSVIKDQDEANIQANKILKKISEPIRLHNHTLNITGSIGISLYPLNGKNMETLMMNADIAMYRAKELGRDNFQFFTTDMNAQISQRLQLENDLHRALAEKQFLLHYQPILDLNTGQITGLEALLRWQHPEKGLIPPNEFIPIAEETGLIVPIGEWVIETACTTHLRLQTYSSNPLYISINISSRQLKRGDLVEIVSRVLRKTGIPPDRLELELTESILIEETFMILELLSQLKTQGIKLVIDDFGTGYSNLGYLKQFPLDKLKIDKSFVYGINGNPNDAAIAQTIIAMAHILGLKVIAEGVESAHQLDFLKLHECDEMQGFYFSKPIPEKDIIKLLKTHRTLT